jgi:OOP family OmpA-OmpF porin
MMVDGGAGVKVFIKDYLALRGEVRYVRDVEDDFNNFMYTIGLNFMFGGIEKVE